MDELKSASLGAMGSLLRKLDELVPTEGRVRQLRDDLGSISTKLRKLSEVDKPSLTVNYWMKDVRELSYDMEDCVDQFIHADNTEIEKLLGYENRLVEAIERYDRFNLEHALSHHTTTLNHRVRMVHQEPRPVIPVGVEGPTNELRRLVEPKCNDIGSDKQLKVVSILGEGGVGKSMLSQKVWCEVGGQFECRAFVQTARKPDIRMILSSILSQIHKQQPPEACQVANLIHDIRKHLQDKRYFIIIDDLWAVSVWDVVSRAFPEGNCCGRIITTTTIEDVALACCSYDPEYILKMKPLSENQSKQLFLYTVIGHRKIFSPELNDVSDEITRKCGGLPLAIICIGTLIASQQDTLHQSKFVKNFLHDNVITNSTSVGILNEVLELCYSSLSHCLKSCLLYLSVYPENYLILKKHLVKQWIAEDFLCTEEKDIAEVAGTYFDKFVSLGLIQRMDINCNRKELPYVVHPAVFDFVRCKSMEDNFITVIDYSHSTVLLTDKIRRLSLQFGSATYATIPPTIGQSEVRSLAFMGLLGCMPSLVEFKLARVVILHLQGDNGNRRFSLIEIHNLILLRYLEVRCDVTVELPGQIQCLKRLETLQINAEVEDVPLDIVFHSTLQHVQIGKKTQHKNLAQYPGTLILANLSRTHLPAVEVFKLLPPICILPMIPAWIGQLTTLHTLEVVVNAMGRYDLDYLGKLPVLKVVSLYVLKSSRDGHVTFHSVAAPFPALEYFKLVSGVLRLTFPEKGMPKLARLKICFNARREGSYSNILYRIQHLEKLKEVVASIGLATGAEDSDYVAAESALQDIIGSHPSKPKFVKRKRLVAHEEYDRPMSLGSESSSKRDETLNSQSVTQKEDCIATQEIQDQETVSSYIYRQKGVLSIKPGTSGIADTRGTRSASPGDKHLDANTIEALPLAPWQQSLKKIWRREGPASTDIKLGTLYDLVHPVVGKLEALLVQEHVLLSDICGENIRSHLCELSIMRDHYYDISERHWIDRVRNLCYEIDDWTDLFAVNIASQSRVEPSPLSLVGWILNGLDELITLSTPWRHDLYTKARLTRRHDFSRPYYYYNRMNLVSQNRMIVEVIRMLAEVREMAELKIISIVGMAGSGKTTLAAAVYEELRRDFDTVATVSVGPERNMVIKTLEDMLHQLEMIIPHRSNDTSSDLENEQQKSEDNSLLITSKIRESLKNKRYFIVVDDLWTKEEWETIKCCFPEDNRHSRIIVTTSNDALALHCSLGSSDCIYKIGLLSDADSERLFFNKALGRRESISVEIIKKCGGLPLAIVSAAAMLQYVKSMEWWRMDMLSRLDNNYMMQRLELSYNNLPSNLRICMLYLSIFPEYYEVDVERLVRLWIAEAFIVEESGRTMEETARSYLDGLISRNMVLPLHVNHDDIPKSCTVHPVVHSFITYKSSEENVVLRVDGQHQGVDISFGNVRRLSLQNSKKRERNMVLQSSIDLSLARSIIINGQDRTAPRFTDLTVVRVLDLEGCDGAVCLDGLHNLQLLRYLSLRGTDVSELPETIGWLSCLQILDVRSTNVKKLPHSIVKLEKLMYLLCGNVKLPHGIAKMKALQTVSCAIVMNSSSSIMQELSELTDLRELELFFDFPEMPENGRIVQFPGYGFQHVKKLHIHCSSASVTFEPGVLPRVEILELSFDGLSDEKSTGLSGIEYLLSLKNVLVKFSQDEARAVAMVVDLAKNVAATVHPNHPEVSVIVDGRPIGSTIA